MIPVPEFISEKTNVREHNNKIGRNEQWGKIAKQQA